MKDGKHLQATRSRPEPIPPGRAVSRSILTLPPSRSEARRGRPVLQPPQALGDVGGRAGIGEAQRSAPRARVEVEPRRHRHPGLVAGCARRAPGCRRSSRRRRHRCRRRRPAARCGRTPPSAAPRASAPGWRGRPRAFASSSSVASSAASAATWLACGAQMKRFCTSRSIRRTCASGTTIQPIAPAGHREVLGEGVDDVDLVGDLQRRDRARAVLDAVVDLVRDEGDAALRGRARSARASSERSSIVPVGLAGLATSSPARSAREIAPATGWKRSSGPVAIPTGTRSSARRMLR